MRVSYDSMYQEFYRILAKKGFSAEKAGLCAKLFADTSRDGVYSHGLNRFPRYISQIEAGIIHIEGEPKLKESFGVMERYDGQQGPGNLNAYACMKRAVELAKQHTIGCAALSNTNHWLRPGNYGLLAAEENCIGILWTNTMPNMPAWGGRDAHLGNNPVVLAVPHGDNPVLVDVAMSMFSYGKLDVYHRAGKELPVDGGFDENQNPTKDPGKILETKQLIPTGYWKGSGLSLALDLIASCLAGGFTTRMIGELPEETQMCQIFLAVSLDRLPDREVLLQQIDDTLQDLKTSVPMEEGHGVHYPGEHMMEVRKENMELGIPVDEEIWESVLRL